jgi:hypothetical protein
LQFWIADVASLRTTHMRLCATRTIRYTPQRL